MRCNFLRIILVAIFYLMGAPAYTHEINNIRPMMSEDKKYTEYWEQYFYLGDGSLVTSQFLIANFPWPVGKDHGIMLGTLITPEGELYVIKNGRKPGKWGFKEDSLDLVIHTHRLSGNDDNLNVHLENTMAIVDLQLKSLQPVLNHKSYSSKDGFIETSFYAPNLEGSGHWQLGKEAGFNPLGPLHKVEGVKGFGVHVLMTDKIDALVKNWTRIIGVSKEGPKPFLSSIVRPDGTEDILLKIFDGDQTIDSFSDVKITYQNMIEDEDNKATRPTSIEIFAKSEKGTLKGTVTFTKKLNHFNLTEHLNFFEKTFAKSSPIVANFRYLGDYNLTYSTSMGEKTLTGKALSEYTDILPAKKVTKKRRRNRR